MPYTEKIYWQVGDRSTYSKAEALMWAGGDVTKISLYFFDREWQHKNWSSPPKASLEHLIQERCQSLRDQTKHLCLWLSSGYDSVTVLNKYAKFNIMLDELVVLSRRQDDPEFPIAMKIAHDFKKTYQPYIKITEIHLDHNYHRSIYEKHKEEFLLLPGFSLRFSKSMLSVVSAVSDKTLSLFDKSSDRIDINGFDKPRLDLRGNKWYAQFPDDAVIDHVGSRFTGFWIATDAFELYLATCWSVMAWFESLPACQSSLVHEIQSNNELYYPEWCIASGRDLISNSYSHRAQGKKLHLQGIHSPDSVKLTEYWLKENYKIYHSYYSGVKILQNTLSNHWQDINKPIPSYLYTICSRSYYLRDFSVKVSAH